MNHINPDVGQSINPLDDAGQPSENQMSENNIETTAQTAHNRAKKPKAVIVDQVTTIQNRTMSAWGANYLQTVIEAQADSQLTAAQAKRNAEYWILEQGVGQAYQFTGEETQHPFLLLTGQQLLDAIREPTPPQTPRKRARSIDEDDQQSKRQRSSPIQPNSQDNASIAIDDHETTIEPQVGRGQVAPLTERSDSMPWNVYASSRKTSRIGSVRPARIASSSAAGFIPFDTGVPSTIGSHRLSRYDSPLDQRRRQLALRLEGPIVNDRDEFDADLELMDEFAVAPHMDSHFELPMPDESKVDPQWLAAGLEDEAFNFLTFLKDSIAAKQEDTISFEEIVPVEDNTNIVAAQGFLHVLSLATKGLLTVQQEEAFGDIEIGIVEGLDREVVVEGEMDAVSDGVQEEEGNGIGE